MVKAILLSITLLLSGCSSETVKERIEVASEEPEILTKKRYNDLINLPLLEGPAIPVAVYRFPDLTGQRKPAQNFASLSSAVTQGSEVFLIKALQDAGKGKWFQVVERVSLDNLVKERQLIRSQRELYEKEQAKPLTPLLVAGIMLDGGIVGYDSNIGTGGIGARFLGIGATQEYRKDEVTIVIRVISINTGEVLLSTGASKTVFSTSAGVNIFKFVDMGTKSVEFEAGSTINEPTTYAVRIAIEAAITDMVKEGAKKKLWAMRKK
jgi:curli production assembly/transport component CsgG